MEAKLAQLERGGPTGSDMDAGELVHSRRMLEAMKRELLLRETPARHALVARRILPSFLVRAGACPLMFSGSNVGVNLSGCTKGAPIRV